MQTSNLSFENPQRFQTLSINNKEILNNYAKEILNKHLNISRIEPAKQKSPLARGLEYIRSYLPDAHSAGRYIGTGLAYVHASEMSNQFIAEMLPLTSNTVFKILTGLDLPSGDGKMARAVKKVATEASQIALTPIIVEAVHAMLPPALGLGAAGTAALIQWIYSRLTIDPKAKERLLPVSGLENTFMVNEKGQLVDTSGCEITFNELKRVVKWINQYDLACQLHDAKVEEIDKIFEKYLTNCTIIENGIFLSGPTYTDDQNNPLSQKKIKLIEEAKDILKGGNFTKKNEEIEKAIDYLAKINVAGKTTPFHELLEQKQHELISKQNYTKMLSDLFAEIELNEILTEADAEFEQQKIESAKIDQIAIDALEEMLEQEKELKILKQEGWEIIEEQKPTQKRETPGFFARLFPQWLS